MEKRKVVVADTIDKRVKLFTGRVPPLKTEVVKGEKASAKVVDTILMDSTLTMGGSTRSGSTMVVGSSPSRGDNDKNLIGGSERLTLRCRLTSRFTTRSTTRSCFLIWGNTLCLRSKNVLKTFLSKGSTRLSPVSPLW